MFHVVEIQSTLIDVPRNASNMFDEKIIINFD